MIDILECDIRPTALGQALLIQVERRDRKAMSWREIQDAFAAAYPGQWAVQVHPPQARCLDQANRYHLFVLSEKPAGMDLCAPPPKGTRDP